MKDNDWPPPTEEQVRKAVAALADPQLHGLFFEGLENPEWLEPLQSMKAFIAAPEPWIDDQGMKRVAAWPEGTYLARIATDKPSQVVSILLALAQSDNPWVHRCAVAVGKTVPLDQAERLAPQIIKRIGSDEWGWFDGRSVLEVAERFVDERPALTLRILNALFKPEFAREKRTALGIERQARTALDEYQYRELIGQAIERIFPRLPSRTRGLSLCISWLLSYLDATGRRSTRIRQSGTFWRPSIAPHEQNSDYGDIFNGLIEAIVRYAMQVVQSEGLQSAIDALTRTDEFLLSRICIEVTRQALIADGSEPNIAAAFALLTSPHLLSMSARPEYVNLAVVALPQLADEQLAEWIGLVRSEAWQGTDEEIRVRAAWPDTEPESATADQIANVRRVLRYRLLLPLEDVIPAGLREEFDAMAIDYGPIEHPEFASWHESWVGPSSPRSADELAAMAPAELIRYLRTWTPEYDHGPFPSVEGLARALEEFVAREPDTAERMIDEIRTLGAPYIRAIVAGWTGSVESGWRPSEQVWRLLGDLTGRNVQATATEDEQSTWMRSDVVRLVERLTREDARQEADVRHALAVVAPVCSDDDPTPEEEERYGGTNMDPLTLSLNTTRPSALRCMARIAMRANEIGSESAHGVSRDALSVIDTRLGPGKDASLATAAVFGEALGVLHNADSEWLNRRLSVILGGLLSEVEDVRSWSDVALSVALKSYQPSSGFFDLVRPAIAEMFTARYFELDHVDGWHSGDSAPTRAADHLLWAYVIGHVELTDGLIAQLFTLDALAESASKALGHVGWSMMHNEPPQEALERATALIEWRLAEARAGRSDLRELGDFYWWVRSERFAAAWWLPVLLLAVENPQFDARGMLGDSLANASREHPRETVEVLARMLGRETDAYGSYDLYQNAAQILLAALNSADPDAMAAANSLRDVLARRGRFEILRSVDALRGGS